MMLSRVAEALYWMGRYLERAEHAARVLEAMRDLRLDLGEVAREVADEQWHGALRALSLPDLPVARLVLDEGGFLHQYAYGPGMAGGAAVAGPVLESALQALGRVSDGNPYPRPAP